MQLLSSDELEALRLLTDALPSGHHVHAKVALDALRPPAGPLARWRLGRPLVVDFVVTDPRGLVKLAALLTDGDRAALRGRLERLGVEAVELAPGRYVDARKLRRRIEGIRPARASRLVARERLDRDRRRPR